MNNPTSHLYYLINKIYHANFEFYKILYFNYKNIFERKEIDFIKRKVKAGQVVLDIGANIGFYTLLLSDLVGKEGRVYAFEPERKNFQHLKGLCGERTNVTLVDSAVGDKDGELNLYISEKLNVDHHTFDSGLARESIFVKSVSIDKYFKVRKKIDFVKIDTQGFEYNVILGMKRTIKKFRNMTILCEVVPNGLKSSGASVEKLFNLFRSLGFETMRISNDYGGSSGYFDIVATKS